MGAGPGNSFLNAGVITVAGDNLIDMGAGNTGTFTNVNWINFIDGDTDDVLTVSGNMGGTGALGLDVDLSTLSSDQLYVDGNMTATAAQHVDILFEGMPLTAHTSIDFAHVSGTSVAGSFVPGQILSYNPARNFLDLGFTIGSTINTANTADDVFSVNLDVNGLNDTGTLAASAATGAATMLNDQIGTFRQRMGVNPYGDAGKVMSAFFRTYTTEGDVSPDHVAANFGQGGNFDYDQSTWGREVGVNANLFGNFHAGVVLGSADGRQRLTGAGVGSNRMDGMTWGAYATWFAPQGYYIDLSGRWMAVDIHSTSAAGTLQARAHTSAINLETGYNWTTGGGFTITPQFQYTRTKVEDLTAFDGDRADFEGHGGTSSRARLGVEFSKTFASSGGMKFTPYASINAIRESDGKMNYTVADNFYGATSIEGTSSMAELGLGMQKGGFAVTAGANWVDGGAFNSVMGGQLVVRFAW
jgi:outer membrane autotransporter protein